MAPPRPPKTYRKFAGSALLRDRQDRRASRAPAQPALNRTLRARHDPRPADKELPKERGKKHGNVFQNALSLSVRSLPSCRRYEKSRNPVRITAFVLLLVPRGRLELPRHSALPPQDSVSTNSTTWARGATYRNSLPLASIFFRFRQKKIRSSLFSLSQGSLTEENALLRDRLSFPEKGGRGLSHPVRHKKVPPRRMSFPHRKAFRLSAGECASVSAQKKPEPEGSGPFVSIPPH